MSTKSERLFESFCQVHSVVCKRVREMTEARPDYELEVNGRLVLVEVKQFDPNEEERAALIRQAKGEQVSFGGKPGKRLRRAIGSANTQLRQLQSGRPVPTFLVVYNNTPCSLHTGPGAVMFAMQGLDVIDIEVPPNPSESPWWGAFRSGPERMMRADANTSTSAVGVLSEIDTDTTALCVFHNRYAACPLEPGLMRLPGVAHFRLPEGATNSVEAVWQEA